MIDKQPEPIAPISARNYGIDLLRIVSMIMIVFLHLVSHSDLMESIGFLSTKYEAVRFVDTFMGCAVDSFALISGFVGYGHKFKYSKLIYLWFEVVFYGLGITLITKAISPESVSGSSILSNCFPVLFCNNWYFASYFCMAFFVPAFNFLIEKMSFRKMSCLIVVSIGLFSVMQNLPVNRFMYGDIFCTMSGYSPLWLSVLYILGAYLHKYKVHHRKPIFYFIMYFVSSLATFIYKAGIEVVWYYIFGSKLNNITDYTTPTVLLSAIFLVLFFSSITITDKKTIALISFFAPASFGVLLIHENGYLQPLLYGNLNVFYGFNTALLIVILLGLALTIWLICSLIDKLRFVLFKLLRVMKLCCFLENWYYKILDRVLNAVQKVVI